MYRHSSHELDRFQQVSLCRREAVTITTMVPLSLVPYIFKLKMSSQGDIDKELETYRQGHDGGEIEEARKRAEAMIAYMASQANEPQTPEQESCPDKDK